MPRALASRGRRSTRGSLGRPRDHQRNIDRRRRCEARLCVVRAVAPPVLCPGSRLADALSIPLDTPPQSSTPLRERPTFPLSVANPPSRPLYPSDDPQELLTRTGGTFERLRSYAEVNDSRRSAEPAHPATTHARVARDTTAGVLLQVSSSGSPELVRPHELLTRGEATGERRAARHGAAQGSIVAIVALPHGALRASSTMGTAGSRATSRAEPGRANTPARQHESASRAPAAVRCSRPPPQS